MHHVLDLSDSPAYLHVQYDQLKIERDGAAAVSLPLADIAVLILGHPQVTCTQSVFAGLMENGAAVIACDRHHLPAGLMAPLVGHFAQAERIAAQAAASRPTRKRLWKQIVVAKLRAQAALLSHLRGHDADLGALARAVRSGDPENVEAQAARRYWPLLFDDPAFRRRRDADDQNRLLNYGYAVLRAVVARSLCAAGLQPSLGLHHHNRYDAFCLADDLMEPYRPLVDAAVVTHLARFGGDTALDRSAKVALLEAITGRYACAGEVRSLFDLVNKTSSSLAAALLGQGQRLFFPEEFRRAGE